MWILIRSELTNEDGVDIVNNYYDVQPAWSGWKTYTGDGSGAQAIKLLECQDLSYSIPDSLISYHLMYVPVRAV